MRTIHKFPLSLVDKQIVEMPTDAKILSVQDQGGVLVLWAMLDPRHPKRPREVTIIGTGHPVPEDLVEHSYVDTARLGPFVWHVFASRF